jgi:hypothetical protein
MGYDIVFQDMVYNNENERRKKFKPKHKLTVKHVSKQKNKPDRFYTLKRDETK